MGMWVGRGRKARVAYGFDDIALVPGTVTVNPNEVDISWDLCGHRYELPIIAAAMDGVVGPQLAIEMGRHGGLAVLNLEGIFARYANPDEVLERIVSASQEEATKIIQSIYGEPIMTASAPDASALHTSPPVVMPPSVMIGTYRPVCL